MSANTNPIYGRIPVTSYCQVTTGNTARDGSGSPTLLATGGPDGTRINAVLIEGVGTVTDGIVRLFLSLDGGTTKRLLAEVAITATTPSATVPGFTTTWIFNATEPLYLPDASAILYATTHNSETFNLFASGLKY